MSTSPAAAAKSPVASKPPSTASSPVAAEGNESCMVFVGNLSYQTRETELRDIFSKSGNVVNAKIVFRGPRSLGYGFVTFSKESEAESAANTLKNYEFDGRAINVERAVPASERAERPSRGRGRGRGRGGNRRRADDGHQHSGEGADAAHQEEDGNDAEGGEGASYARRGGRGRGGRGRRGGRNARPARPDGPPSKTTIFVGNLPFKVVDQDLYNIFANYHVVKAHVVLRPSGTSRGYGFVTVESESDQAKALAELIDVECDGRSLAIRAALSEEAHKGKDATAAAAEADEE